MNQLRLQLGDQGLLHSLVVDTGINILVEVAVCAFAIRLQSDLRADDEAVVKRDRTKIPMLQYLRQYGQ